MGKESPLRKPTPDLVSEPELQEYFLHRKNVNRWAPKTMRICYCGIRFFYVHVLACDWHILSILRAQNEHRLPAVLSVDEVRKLFGPGQNFPHHVFLSTVYSCGLRLDEARHLEVSDIDSRSCGGLLKLRSLLPPLKILRRSG
jgi:integrase/recombinase XerD